jgi:hypothetical protein
MQAGLKKVARMFVRLAPEGLKILIVWTLSKGCLHYNLGCDRFKKNSQSFPHFSTEKNE